MKRLLVGWVLWAQLFSLTVLADTQPTPEKTPGEDLDKISEFNRVIWRWRRCVSRYESEHGPSKDGKPPGVCGEEPKPPAKY